MNNEPNKGKKISASLPPHLPIVWY
jgi:hypothetical protein